VNVRLFTPRRNKRAFPVTSRVHRVVVAVLGVLVLGAATTAVASASPKWYVDGTEVLNAKAITETGSVTLEEPRIGIAFTCNVEKTGTVGPGGSSEITKWTFSSCAERGSAGCHSPGLEAGTSPWSMELATVGTEIHNLMGKTQRSSIVVKCGVFRLDTCERVPAEFLTNNRANATVNAQYLRGKDERFECVATKQGEAVLVGTLEIARRGYTLEVK
jgi:hypothetical protein